MAESQNLEQFKNQARLPKFAIPSLYEIFLKPDLNSCKFTGTVQISINIIEDTQFLILNAADLSVKNESFWFKSQTHSQILQPSEITLVEEDEILVVFFSDVLPHGEGLLHIGFDGTLNDRMKGFYKRLTKPGNRRTLATFFSGEVSENIFSKKKRKKEEDGVVTSCSHARKSKFGEEEKEKEVSARSWELGLWRSSGVRPREKKKMRLGLGIRDCCTLDLMER